MKTWAIHGHPKRSKREVYAINGSRPQNIYVISYMGSICLSHGKRSQSAGVDASKAFQSRTLCGTLPRFQREGHSNSRSKHCRNLQKTAKFVFLECKLMCSLFLSTQSSLLWESFIAASAKKAQPWGGGQKFNQYHDQLVFMSLDKLSSFALILGRIKSKFPHVQQRGFGVWNLRHSLRGSADCRPCKGWAVLEQFARTKLLVWCFRVA